MKRVWLAAGLAVGVLAVTRPSAAATVRVTETPVGVTADFDVLKSVSFSDDARHLAMLGVKGEKQLVVRDGVASAAYEWVIPDSLTMSPDGRRLGFVVQDGNDMSALVDGKVVGKGYFLIADNRIHFSADGNHFAYTARVGDEGVFVVRDGTAGAVYPAAAGVPTFSPDGQHLAYAAVLPAGKMCVVLDGKEQPPFDGVASATLQFSPDSKRLAYTAVQDHKYIAVIDGAAGKPLEKMWFSPIFSPDSKRVAYLAGDTGQYFAVVDGKAGPSFDGFDGPCVFSPDSKHIAYAGRHGGQWTVVRDETPGEPFDEIAGESLRFSPDSNRLAYAAARGAQRFVVLDGKPQTPYEHIARPGMLFSPDSKRLAYAAVRGKQLLVIADGVESVPYVNVLDLGFSPDSKHLAYRAVIEKQPVLVMDGKAGEPFDTLSPVAFGPDGAHWVFAGLRGTTASIYVDGVPLPEAYTAWVRDSRPVFARNDAVDLLMARERNLLQVRLTIGGAATQPGR